MVVKKLLPYGVKDYYPQELEPLKRVLKEVEAELNLWGYEEIKLPTLEYKELFETTLGESLRDGFLLKDCEGGEVLALRYDFTPQIVRFVLHRKERSYPLRVFYRGETFKAGRELWEEINVGFELVGAPSVEADAEVIAVIEGILQRLGLKDYTLVVGHREAYRHLSEMFSPKAVKLKRYTHLMENYLRNYPLLGEDWENLELPERVKEELSTLRSLLKTYRIGERAVFNPSLEPERDYYSGLFFKVVHRKGVLARGGRYDRLFEFFGEKIPATGGGLKVNTLLEVLEYRRKTRKGVYIIDTNPDKVWSWKIAKFLRKRGIPVERDIIPRSKEISLSHAEDRGYPTVLLVEGAYLKPLKGKGVGKKIPLPELEDNLDRLLEIV